MGGKTRRIILHLDMDSFYASVEVRERPELAGKPVVIGADPKEGKGRGVVSTCSYEARAFGIRSAMPVSQAFLCCPHAIFLPPRFHLYTRASADVMAILHALGYRLQQVSIDEAFLDVSPVGTFCAAYNLAEQIQDTIRKRLGLTCSIGIGSGKVIAKIASDFKKPGGLTVVEPYTTGAFLAPLPVRKIPGIGKRSEAELLELGIRTIGDLASCNLQALVARFGRGAVTMHTIAGGTDASEVTECEGAKSVSRETTFDADTGNTQVMAVTMDALAEDVHRALVEGDLRCKTITVKVRYQGFITISKARTLSHYTDNAGTIRTCAHALLRGMYDGRKVRLLGIRLSSFDRRDDRQRTLEP
jgi:DNA polymerase IV (DinB-like DNA polymerase)